MCGGVVLGTCTLLTLRGRVIALLPLRGNGSLLLGAAILPLDTAAAPLDTNALLIQNTDGGTDKQFSVAERPLFHFVLCG